jgi:hypothetical protein
MSSTGLRQVIARGTVDDVEERLRSIAMSPELLARFVKERMKKT